MNRLYVRWAVLLAAAVVIASMAWADYQRRLISLSPEQMLAQPTTGTVRVQGMVEAGTLDGDADSGHVRFMLGGDGEAMPVQYDGPPPENLRELKTLVVLGEWDDAAKVFRAHETALVANYGFVAGAYLIGLIPLGLFLFAMERKVGQLYREIKQSKLYEPEAGHDVDTR